MAHVRTQIRQQFKTVLDAALPSPGYKVFASRHYARNHIPGEAIVDMRFLNDQTSDAEAMGPKREHIASLYIRVQRSAPDELLDDALDADDVIITKAIAAHDWSSMLEEQPELVQVNFSDSAETGSAIGSLVLRYDLVYRIDMNDPEVIIP